MADSYQVGRCPPQCVAMLRNDLNPVPMEAVRGETKGARGFTGCARPKAVCVNRADPKLAGQARYN